MNAEETTAALLAIVKAHRAIRGHGTRKGNRSHLRRTYVNLFNAANLPVKVYRRAGDKHG